MAPSETQGPRTCVACKNNYAANSVSMFYPFPLKGVNNTNQKTTTQCLRCRRIASVRGAIRKQGRTVSRAAKIAILRRQERDLQQWRKDLRKVTAVPFAGDDLRNGKTKVTVACQPCGSPLTASSMECCQARRNPACLCD